MSKIDQLQRLAQLREQGLLTEAEFNDAKTALISADASEAAISEEKPISTPLTEATTNPAPEPPPVPTPDPTPVPESSFISEEEITPVSFNEKYDNYGRPIKPEFDQYGRSNNDSNATSIVVGLGFIVFIFVFIAVVSQTPQNNTQLSNTKSTTQKEKAKGKPPSTKYRDALNSANEAILKKEHNRAIKYLNAIKNDYDDFSDIDIKKVNTLISNAKKKIKFLDQPGKYPYTERKWHGFQWYDQDNNNGFKIFFAHSRECINPRLTFEFSRDNGPVEATYTAKPKSNISTFVIPFQLPGIQSISEPIVKCS